MEVFAIQLDTVWQDPSASFERVRQLLAGQTIPPGSLLVLPEMFARGYSMKLKQMLEPEDGPSVQFLAEVARRFNCWAMGGVATSGPGDLGRNECVVVNCQGMVASRYRKMQPFSLSREGNYFEAGSAPCVFDWEAMPVATFVCYDLRFPEIFRPVARRVQLITVIANWPETRQSHWQALLRARAIENLCYVVGVNRAGNDPHTHYVGGSLIISPLGEILAEAGSGETLIRAAVVSDVVSTVRQKLPFLDDLRKEFVRDFSSDQDVARGDASDSPA